MGIGDRLAEVREGSAEGELPRRGSENVTGVEGRRRGRRDRQRYELRVRRQKGKQPVVGSDEVVPRCSRGERTAGRAHARIHHCHVNRLSREAMPYARQDVLRGAHVARRDLVGDVRERRAMHARQQHPFHLTEVTVRITEIGEQRDESGH